MPSSKRLAGPGIEPASPSVSCIPDEFFTAELSGNPSKSLPWCQINKTTTSYRLHAYTLSLSLRKIKKHQKLFIWGTSLVIQWLKLCVSTARGWFDPWSGTKELHVTCPPKLNFYTFYLLSV